MKSASVWRWRWQDRSRRLGDEHPAARAAFGRYVALIAGQLGKSAGQVALTAWARVHSPGYLNRSTRRPRP